MMLEAHVILCMTEPDLLKIIILPPKLGKEAEPSVVRMYRKILLLIFFNL